MKKLNAVLGLLTALTAFSTGCYVGDPNPNPTNTPCYDASVSVINSTGEAVNVTVDGTDYDEFSVLPGSTGSTSVPAGSYLVFVEGASTFQVYASESVTLGCNGTYVVEAVGMAQFQISNTSVADLDVYVDGNLVTDVLYPNSTMTFDLTAEYHHIYIEATYGQGFVYEEDGVYAGGVLYPINITPSDIFYPLVTLTNDSFNDYCAYAMENGGYYPFEGTSFDPFAVCPGEMGYFEVSDGDHIIDLFWDDTPSATLDTYIHSLSGFFGFNTQLDHFL